MTMRLFAFLVAFAAASFAGVFQASADVPPPYDLYGIGVKMIDATPYPKISQVEKGGPAALAGVKAGDQVLAIDGTYSNSPAPYYFFARGLEGPKDSVAELILLRNNAQVLVVKVKRTLSAE
jgi:C-terminal processing protease CtpA/Prc